MCIVCPQRLDEASNEKENREPSLERKKKEIANELAGDSGNKYYVSDEAHIDECGYQYDEYFCSFSERGASQLSTLARVENYFKLKKMSSQHKKFLK